MDEGQKKDRRMEQGERHRMNTGVYSHETPQGAYEYREDSIKEEKAVTVTGYSGTDTQICLPDYMRGLPVRKIMKKTFLSRKHLRKIFMPDTLEEIGDWAFAYCSSLEVVFMPRKPLELGNRIFMECSGIKKIYTYETGETEEAVKAYEAGAAYGKADSPQEQTAVLLAAAAVMLEAEYLMNPLEAGSPAWYKKWDARMENIMNTEDSEGYTKLILCGEEDYGTNLEDYRSNRRKEKARLALLRLRNPAGLEDKNAVMLKEYLTGCTKGCSTEEAWEVVLGEYGYDKEYFQLFADIGGIHQDNFDEVLKDMKDGYAEMKAFLIWYREEKMEKRDFFDTLSLAD